MTQEQLDKETKKLYSSYGIEEKTIDAILKSQNENQIAETDVGANESNNKVLIEELSPSNNIEATALQSTDNLTSQSSNKEGCERGVIEAYAPLFAFDPKAPIKFNTINNKLKVKEEFNDDAKEAFIYVLSLVFNDEFIGRNEKAFLNQVNYFNRNILYWTTIKDKLYFQINDNEYYTVKITKNKEIPKEFKNFLDNLKKI